MFQKNIFAVNSTLESFTTPEDREHGVVTTLNFTVHRINGNSQALFTLSHRNKALRHAAGDTWGVMKKSKISTNKNLIFNNKTIYSLFGIRRWIYDNACRRKFSNS